jgi:hypothetical protein
MKQGNPEEQEARITNLLSIKSGNMLQSAVVNIPVQLRKCTDSVRSYIEI